MIKKLTQPKQRKKIFRKWHRRLGLTVSLFLANLAITGLMLNHYESLSLHKNYIQNSWLLEWYGVTAPQKILCLESTSHQICEIDKLTYLIETNKNIRLIGKDIGSLVSLIFHKGEFHLVTKNNIMIFDNDFQLLESLNTIDDISATIVASSYSNNRLLLMAEGLLAKEFLENTHQILELDLSTLDFKNISNNDLIIQFSSMLETYPLADQEVIVSLAKAYEQRQITQLRFVQDLHSGQLFSFSGKLLTDMIAIAILLLIISGISTWYRRKN